MLRYHRGLSRDATGNFIPLAYVHAYLPGTQTYVAIYSDEAGTTPLQQPIRSDAQGIYQFYTREPVIDLRYVLPLVPTGYAYKVPLQVRQTPFVINVDSYGATGDGITDDRAAVQSAVDAATAIGPGSIVRFTPGRTYAIVGEILGQETLIIDLTGAKIAHKATAYGKGLFRFRPPQQFAIAWPYDIEANSREWLEQDPPYSQGDYLLFTTNYDWIDRQYKYGNTHYGQAFLVERVHQGTVTLSDFFVQGMRASDGIELRSFKRISPVIRGGEIQTDDNQASGGQPGVSYCIRFCHCVNPRIEGTRLSGLAFQYSTYVRFEHCFAPVADGLRLNAVSLPRGSVDGVYAVHFAGATSHGQLLNSDCHGLRHMSDAQWANLEDGEGEVVLLRICGVFWSLVKNCRSFDSVSSGFGPHGCGRYFDFIDCQAFNSGRSGFSTRVSYTRFINCTAVHAFQDLDPAFSIGHGVQSDENAQGQYAPSCYPGQDHEGGAFGGQNPLVGCELVNCTQTGYRDGLFRLCNMATVSVRDCSMVLPYREHPVQGGTEPYYRRWAFFQYSNPRLWEVGLPNSSQRYLAGDWIRDCWQEGESWEYALYECKESHLASALNRPATSVEQNGGETDIWRRIDGQAGRPSPLRGTLNVLNSRFIHEHSGWRWNGLHPEWVICGPVVYPSAILLEGVEFGPSVAMDSGNDHCGLYARVFRFRARGCRCLSGPGSAQKYAIRLLVPGYAAGDVMYINGDVADAEIDIEGCRLEGSIGPWEVDHGLIGTHSEIAANLTSEGDLRLSGSLSSSGGISAQGSLECAGRVFAGGGFAYGGSLGSVQPNNYIGCLPLHDASGNTIGYIRLFSS
jgi:hypothetical protein